MSRISSETAVWNQYRQYFSGFPSFLCASTKEMRNTTTKNRIIFVHCKQLPPTHLLCFFSSNIFVFPNTFHPPPFTSSCSSHFFLSILLPLLPPSFQMFFLYFHSYGSHSHIISSPPPIAVFSILLFSSLYSSFLSSFTSFLQSYLFIKLFIYSSRTFISTSKPFSHILYFFLQHFALLSPNPFPISCFFTSFFFLSASSSDHTSFFSFSPPSILSLLPYAKYHTEGTILGNIESLETTPGFMVPIGCQVILKIPLRAKSSSLSLTFIVFLLGKVAAARDSCHLAAQFPRRSS